MIKSHWKLRLLNWYARRVLKVPFIVDFTPEEMPDVYALGFAWSQAAAQRMRGDDMLIERVKQAEQIAAISTGTRASRRLVNRAARRAAKKELNK